MGWGTAYFPEKWRTLGHRSEGGRAEKAAACHHLTLKEASERLGIHPSVLGKWKCRYRKEPVVFSSSALSSESLIAENRQLKAEVRRLE